MNRFKNVLLMLAALAMGMLGSSLTAMVSADGETIHACINPGNGTIYRVAPDQACGQGQQRLVWNVQGPQGLQGPAGPQGPQGPAGPGGFISTDLSWAWLPGADLRFRNLAGFNLTSATLSNANLLGTNLSNTNLTSATLSNANLGRANLSNATYDPNFPPAVDGTVYDNTICPDGTSSGPYGATCSGHGLP